MKAVVSIDIDGSSIKAVAIKRKGKKAIISSCAQIARTGGALSADIGNLLKEKNFASGKGIIITDDARFLSSELGGVQDKNKVSEDNLTEAAKWEMEPYLDFPVAEGLFACQVQERETGGGAMPVLISAVSRKIYSEFSKILKGCGLDLYRVYSPEAASTTVLSHPAGAAQKIVIDCRQGSVKGIHFVSTGPISFQSNSLDSAGLEQAAGNVIQSLMENADTSTEIIAAGNGMVDDLMEMLRPKFENIRKWVAEDSPVKIDAAPGVNLSPEYAAAVGAAVQELGLAGRTPFGATDKVFAIKSIQKKIKEDERILCAVALAPLVLFIGGHYASVRLSTSRYAGAVNLLKEEKKELSRPIEKKKMLEAKFKEARQRRQYLEEVLPARKRNLLSAFSAISRLRPSDMVLTRFYKKENNRFIIEGDALYGRSVAHFKNELSTLTFCDEVVIKSLNSEGSREKKFFPCHFTMGLKFKEAE